MVGDFLRPFFFSRFTVSFVTTENWVDRPPEHTAVDATTAVVGGGWERQRATARNNDPGGEESLATTLPRLIENFEATLFFCLNAVVIDEFKGVEQRVLDY